MILEAIYEGSFENSSHGFRPQRSPHTALSSIQKTFNNTKWFIEGDIKGFFDNIDHEVLIAILSERISDERFLRLIRKFLNAGYVEDWIFHKSYSGTPQGGIISPILANMTLDGIEKKLVERFHTNALGKVDSRFKNAHKVNFVRYADDFVVTAATPELALEAKELIREFLAERGLELSDEKTVVTNIDDGFDFLG